MSKATSNFFNKEMAERYDERNRKLIPISDCLHFLSQLVLNSLPAQSHILCVGAGTGSEILSLSKSFPEWTFVALDPSAEMLEVCKERLRLEGLHDRCQFVQGYIQDIPHNTSFDAVLSLLVAHFIKTEDRSMFFENIYKRLKSKGYLINAEISFDLDSPEFTLMLKNWESIQSLMGATPESLATLPTQLQNALNVLAPEQSEALIRKSGFSNPIKFFQAFMICAWYGIKN